jgi:hypothetical protein
VAWTASAAMPLPGPCSPTPHRCASGAERPARTAPAPDGTATPTELPRASRAWPPT